MRHCLQPELVLRLVHRPGRQEHCLQERHRQRVRPWHRQPDQSHLLADAWSVLALGYQLADACHPCRHLEGPFQPQGLKVPGLKMLPVLVLSMVVLHLSPERNS